jgi:sortase (surface protein transpeptidase)
VVPSNIQKVGWYKYGARPGSARGSTVLVGHRDGTSPEPGVFYHIGSLKSGDIIIVVSDGSHGGNNGNVSAVKTTYKVKSKQFLPKKLFSAHAGKIFALDGKHRLVLISCSGEYDANRGGYQDNVIVTATP